MHEEPTPIRRTDPRDDRIPEALERDLRLAFGAVPGVPGGFDDRILAAAHTRLQARVGHRSWALCLSAGAGIAAAVALSALVWFAPVSSPALPVASADDVNRDGRVDVLDAMALAFENNAGDAANDAEVRRLMARVVSLSPVAGGGQG